MVFGQGRASGSLTSLSPGARTPGLSGRGAGPHGALPGVCDSAEEVPVRLASGGWRTRPQSRLWVHHEPTTLQTGGPL